MIRAIADVEITHGDVCVQQKEPTWIYLLSCGIWSQVGELQCLYVLQVERSCDSALLKCFY